MRKLSTSVALIFLATVASAATFDVTDMRQGRTMLEQQISSALESFGIEQDLSLLSLSQIAIIEGILTESDYSDGDRKSAIEAAIRNN